MNLSPAIAQAARTSARHLADRSTPFAKECWYVAGFATEVSRTPLARTVLGKPLMLIRDSAGAPVASDDRCPHRSFPLSRSRIVGDTLVCGFHGLRYDLQGQCLGISGQSGTPSCRRLAC